MENPALLLRPPSWTRSAACAGQVTADDDWWHPHDDLPPSVKSRQFAAARLVCADCPVRHPCALEALRGAVAHGMYGGLTPAERRDIARRHGYPLPGAAAHGERSRYVAGCRCDDCTAAHRLWARTRRAAVGPQWGHTEGLKPRRPQSPRTKVLRAVKRADGPITARAVFRRTGVKVSRVRQIVAAAVAAGELAPGMVA